MLRSVEAHPAKPPVGSKGVGGTRTGVSGVTGRTGGDRGGGSGGKGGGGKGGGGKGGGKK